MISSGIRPDRLAAYILGHPRRRELSEISVHDVQNQWERTRSEEKIKLLQVPEKMSDYKIIHYY